MGHVHSSLCHLPCLSLVATSRKTVMHHVSQIMRCLLKQPGQVRSMSNVVVVGAGHNGMCNVMHATRIYSGAILLHNQQRDTPEA